MSILFYKNYKFKLNKTKFVNTCIVTQKYSIVNRWWLYKKGLIQMKFIVRLRDKFIISNIKGQIVKFIKSSKLPKLIFLDSKQGLILNLNLASKNFYSLSTL